MSAESRTPTVPKHSLVEHWNDASMWWFDVRGHNSDGQVIFFLAYERWLNDRDLLSVENGHVFDRYLPDPVRDHPGRIWREP